MENMLKITKPGGQLLLLIPGHHPFFTVWDELSKYPKWAEYMTVGHSLIIH